jgi:acetamidase/formamidase
VRHELPLDRRSLHGHFSRDLAPVLTVEPGDSVRLETPNGGWGLRRDELFEPRTSPEDDGHALAGPIELRGAREGDTLCVRIDDVSPGPWGVTEAAPNTEIHWELADGVGHASTGHEVTLAPFLGVMGMPPIGHGVHSTTPPRRQGGNIDCKELVAGTTLYLPVPFDGACFSAGDGHAAQGDGEVSGTAIECPTTATVTLDLRDDLRLEWPCARLARAWLTFGFDADLHRAARIALDGMLDLMAREHELGRGDALALASVAVDLRVTQVVNGQLGVHAVLRDDALR